MIRFAALVLAALASAHAALADEYFELGQFDLTGLLPAQFELGEFVSDAQERVFDSHDGAARLVVSGSFDVADRVDVIREETRQSLIGSGAVILEKTSDWGSFGYAGRTAQDAIFYHYSRVGATCEGVPVLGSFLLTYDSAAAATYDALVPTLIGDLFIGACG